MGFFFIIQSVQGAVQFLHSSALTGSFGVLTLIVRKRHVFPEAQKVDFY